VGEWPLEPFAEPLESECEGDWDPLELLASPRMDPSSLRLRLV
jgi:hypothetical protein